MSTQFLILGPQFSLGPSIRGSTHGRIHCKHNSRIVACSSNLKEWLTVAKHHLESAPASEFLANPYFFCENGKEFSWLEAATEIGKSLHAAGQIKDATPRQFPEEAYEELFVSASFLCSPAFFGTSLAPLEGLRLCSC